MTRRTLVATIYQTLAQLQIVDINDSVIVTLMGIEHRHRAYSGIRIRTDESYISNVANGGAQYIVWLYAA